MVVGMSDDCRDPSGNTEAFRAFVASEGSAPANPPAAPNRLPLIIGIAAVLVIAIIVIAALAL